MKWLKLPGEGGGSGMGLAKRLDRGRLGPVYFEVDREGDARPYRSTSIYSFLAAYKPLGTHFKFSFSD